MKRENSPSPPRDEAVAVALAAESPAKRQKPNEPDSGKTTSITEQLTAHARLAEGKQPGSESKQSDVEGKRSDSESKKPGKESESKQPETESKVEKIPYQDVLRSKNRHRLPDKIMRCLCDGIEPEVLWWSPHDNGFTVDADTVQEKLLDVHFRGTKLTSLVRSLNRWGFRRDFYRTLPKKALAFLHPQFQKGKPHLLRDMKILSSTTQVVDSSSDDEEEAKSEPQPKRGKPAAAQPQRLDSSTTKNPSEARRVAAQQQVATAFSGAGILNHPGQQNAAMLAGIPHGQLATASLLQSQQAQLLNPQLSLLQAGLFQSAAPSPAANQLLAGNAFRDAALLQVRDAVCLQQQRNATTSLLSNSLAHAGLTSGINEQLAQQQQQQQQLQQGQISALLQLQALRAAEAAREASLLRQNQTQLQDVILARKREEALRMLQLNQLQVNSDQGALAASLSPAGVLPQETQQQQAQLQQQPQQEHTLQPSALQQPPPHNPGVSNQLSAVAREREQMNSQIMAMMQQQFQSTRGGETKTDGNTDRAAPPDP